MSTGRDLAAEAEGEARVTKIVAGAGWLALTLGLYVMGGVGPAMAGAGGALMLAAVVSNHGLQTRYGMATLAQVIGIVGEGRK